MEFEKVCDKELSSCCTVCGYIKKKMDDVKPCLLPSGEQTDNLMWPDSSYESHAKRHTCDIDDCIRSKLAKDISKNVCSKGKGGDCVDAIMTDIKDAHNREICKTLLWDY